MSLYDVKSLLSISLIVFSVIYYLISDTQSSTDLSSVNGSNQVADASGTQVLGSTDENSTPIESVEKKEETDESPLQGQYSHSGKLKAVDKNLSFLDRLKELSGMSK